MLNRIYIDNYKSLVNFELSPVSPINLFLGPNGTGKSALFEVLQKIRDFTGGVSKATGLFGFDDLTRWQSSPFQTFEVEIEGNGGSYKYELSVKPDERGQKAQVKYERLWFNDRPLVKFEDGDVHLYRDDHSEGPVYSADWSVSAVASIPPRHDNTRLTWFKERLERFIVVQAIPPLMSESSPGAESYPSFHFENYVSWYRHISQDQGMAYQLTGELREILPGFDHFKFEPVGEKHRLLKVHFRDEKAQDTIGYSFSELSDGQRMLIALYSLLHAVCADKNRKYTLCLDEPENFLALSEIQPWLTALYDRCAEGETQALLISHHPELINYLLASPVGYWFERQSNRPTRVKRVAVGENDGLPISELVARGWLNE